MGTSKGKPTPSGGLWTPVKKEITQNLTGNSKATPDRIVGGTVRALGGLGVDVQPSALLPKKDPKQSSLFD